MDIFFVIHYQYLDVDQREALPFTCASPCRGREDFAISYGSEVMVLVMALPMSNNIFIQDVTHPGLPSPPRPFILSKSEHNSVRTLHPDI